MRQKSNNIHQKDDKCYANANTIYDYYIKQDCDFKLQRCDSTNALGVIIDSKLTFEEHITEKSKQGIFYSGNYQEKL